MARTARGRIPCYASCPHCSLLLNGFTPPSPSKVYYNSSSAEVKIVRAEPAASIGSKGDTGPHVPAPRPASVGDGYAIPIVRPPPSRSAPAPPPAAKRAGSPAGADGPVVVPHAGARDAAVANLRPQTWVTPACWRAVTLDAFSTKNDHGGFCVFTCAVRSRAHRGGVYPNRLTCLCVGMLAARCPRRRRPARRALPRPPPRPDPRPACRRPTPARPRALRLR